METPGQTERGAKVGYGIRSTLMSKVKGVWNCSYFIVGG